MCIDGVGWCDKAIIYTQSKKEMIQINPYVADNVAAVQKNDNTEQCVPKSKAPVLSVLVPIYNTERYLEQALDSLRAQTFGDVKIICINDGSADSSRDIIQKYLDLDSRFRVIDKPNSGYGASMNRGIAESRGEYSPKVFGFWQSKNLDFLLRDPEAFYKKFPINPSRVQKAWYYFTLGGPKLLLDALRR